MNKGASKELIKNAEKKIFDKFFHQWKTLKKAFQDINSQKDGYISKEELRFFFNHWGLNLNDMEFDIIFNKFDKDKDGQLSYNDF